MMTEMTDVHALYIIASADTILEQVVPGPLLCLSIDKAREVQDERRNDGEYDVFIYRLLTEHLHLESFSIEQGLTYYNNSIHPSLLRLHLDEATGY